MISSTAAAQIGRWYLRWDRNEIFQVTGIDSGARTIQILNFDGPSEDIAEDVWARLPLGFADPPSDWTGPLETVDEIDLDSSQPPE